MHGPLHEIGLIELLQLLERGRRTGVLCIDGPESPWAVMLHIVGGVVTAVEPQAGDDAVAVALVARHLRVGNSARDDEAATSVRRSLALRTLAALLQWQHGEFEFEERATGGGRLALSPDALVYELVASEGRRAILSEEFDEFRRVPQFASRATTGGLALGSRDWRVLDAIDGRRSIAAIAVVLDEPPEDVAGSVQVLQLAAILEPVNSPAIPHSAASVTHTWQQDRAPLVTPASETAEMWRARGLAEAAAGRFEAAIREWTAWRASDPGCATEAASLVEAARTMMEAIRDSRD